MPSPAYATTADARWRVRQILRFGNSALPVIGTTMSWLDLNDAINWFVQDVQVQRTNHVLPNQQQAWRSKSAWLGEDFTALKVVVPILFDETGGNWLAASAPLMTSGEQYLTFDNVTALLCRCASVGTGQYKVNAAPYLLATTLEFIAKEPWLKDLSQTTNNGNAVNGSSGAGTTTNLTQSYGGTYFAEPTYVLNVPSGNTRTISSLKIANSTSGETLAVTFTPVLSASTAHTVTVDCGAFKVTDENSTEYDVSGSFPQLYGNPQTPGVNNALAVTLVSSGATAAGLTFDIRFYQRWVP